MLYTEDSIRYISEENLNKIKYITYAIALIVKNNLQHLTNKVSRDKLIYLYNESKEKEKEYEKTENQIESFINYYYKSIVNELTKDCSPSFFVPKNNDEKGEIGGYDI